jgi:hypothetical protein
MLLVRAAVLSGAPAEDAWERWCLGASQQEIADGEVRLLAAAYKGLEERGADGPMVEVARGIYRRTWYVNQLAVARNALIVARLAEAGIPVLMLKGFPLAVRHYGDLGARPMEDLDLLVPPDLVGDAAEALRSLDFAPGAGAPGAASLLGKEIEVRRGDREVVELKAFALVESADDADLWEGSEGFALRDVEARSPCAADHLLLVGAHGQRWNAVQPVSWIVDAATLVRSPDGALDWSRFAERALARRLVPAARRTVAALRGLGIDVPAEVTAELEAAEVTAGERLADRAARAVPTRLGSAVVGWDRYRRFRAQAPPERRPSGPLDWIAGRWEVDGLGGVAAEAGRRITALERSVRERGDW